MATYMKKGRPRQHISDSAARPYRNPLQRARLRRDMYETWCCNNSLKKNDEFKVKLDQMKGKYPEMSWGDTRKGYRQVFDEQIDPARGPLYWRIQLDLGRGQLQKLIALAKSRNISPQEQIRLWLDRL